MSKSLCELNLLEVECKEFPGGFCKELECVFKEGVGDCFVGMKGMENECLTY